MAHLFISRSAVAPGWAERAFAIGITPESDNVNLLRQRDILMHAGGASARIAAGRTSRARRG
jgi:hypothetical protein